MFLHCWSTHNKKWWHAIKPQSLLPALSLERIEIIRWGSKGIIQVRYPPSLFEECEDVCVSSFTPRRRENGDGFWKLKDRKYECASIIAEASFPFGMMCIYYIHNIIFLHIYIRWQIIYSFGGERLLQMYRNWYDFWVSNNMYVLHNISTNARAQLVSYFLISLPNNTVIFLLCIK